MNSKNIKMVTQYIGPTPIGVINDAMREQRRMEMGFYITFARLANLFPESIKFVDAARLGLNVEQHSQLQSKSLAMRNVADPCGFGKMQNILDQYANDSLSDDEIDVIVQLTEEIVTGEKILQSLKDLSGLFLEISQSLPSDIYPFNTHRILINAFVVSMTNFIYAAELYSSAPKSPSIEDNTVTAPDMFLSGTNFCSCFKQLNNFYFENAVI